MTWLRLGVNKMRPGTAFAIFALVCPILIFAWYAFLKFSHVTFGLEHHPIWIAIGVVPTALCALVGFVLLRRASLPARLAAAAISLALPYPMLFFAFVGLCTLEGSCP